MAPVTLPHLAVARIRGADAGSFLHAQLSADIAALEDASATFACYCSPRGQVYGLLLVCRVGPEFRLVADSRLLPLMMKRLGMFVLRADVIIESETDVTVQGRLAEPDVARSSMEFQPAGLDLAYRLAEGAPGSAEDPLFWKQEELRRNVVWLGPETSERFIPQMIGFERIGAVSFSKGCYPGQEIIARARYLGKVKRKPLLIRVFEGPQPLPGESLKLLDGEQWLDSTVIDSVAMDSAKPEAGCMVFVVAPLAADSVETVAFSGDNYRCATM